MEDHVLEYLTELNERLHGRGFSWWVDDYLNMQEALPQLLNEQEENTMEIQTFKVLRHPEGSRITAQQLVELLRINRPDTE